MVLLPIATVIEICFIEEKIRGGSIQQFTNFRVRLHGKVQHSIIAQTHGGKNWGAISALIPGRTNKQCWSRWDNALDPSIDWAIGRMGKWTAAEDSKLKDAVRTHGGKNWDAISTLVSSRTRNQYRNRWHNALNPSIYRGNGRLGEWTEDEDSKLKDAVQTYGGKNWAEIAALVSGRTKNQCYNRWYNALDPSIALTTGREGKWAEDYDQAE
jgi:hypothetical protein